jgi:hypothetical protein
MAWEAGVEIRLSKAREVIIHDCGGWGGTFGTHGWYRKRTDGVQAECSTSRPRLALSSQRWA